MVCILQEEGALDAAHGSYEVNTQPRLNGCICGRVPLSSLLCRRATAAPSLYPNNGTIANLCTTQAVTAAKACLSTQR
tara:strand:- start:7274 stop:7507 length:234 start_codon:yes stop_codon:yes gene_type:complete